MRVLAVLWLAFVVIATAVAWAVSGNGDPYAACRAASLSNICLTDAETLQVLAMVGFAGMVGLTFLFLAGLGVTWAVRYARRGHADR